MVRQFSIDIEMDDTDTFDVDDLERAINSYWFAEHIKDKEICGISWKATWNKEGNYYAGMAPDSWD